MSSEPTFRQTRGRSVLSLVAKLPAVWSGCLAGAWLGGYWPGAERWDRLAALLLGASALCAAAVWFSNAFGWWHEHTLAGLALPSVGRFLLYPLASAVSSQPALASAAGEGLLVASYVFGASVLANAEHEPDRPPPRWPWVLIVLPVVVNAALSARFGPGHLIVVVLPIFWLARIAFGRTAPLGVGRAASLVAGTALVDLSAVVACAADLPWLGWFAILFVLALTFQRFAQTT